MSNVLHFVPLGDLVTLQTDKVFANKDPSLPYIGLEHIAQGSPKLLGVAESSSSSSTNSVFAENDILFGKLRPNLRKSVRARFAGYCSTDILVLRCLAGVAPSFAEHVFQWEQVFAAGSATAGGTKMPRTSWNDLKRFAVFRPSTTAEQTRIAAVLDTVDEAIAKAEAVIAKLKQVRAGLLHDLLTRGLDEHGQLRDPIAHPEQFRDSPLGPVPKEWEVRTCQSLCREIVVGIVVKPAQYYVNEGVAVLRSANVREEGIQLDDLVFISHESNALLAKSKLYTDDLVTIRSGYPGATSAVPSGLNGSNCIDLIVSRPGKEVVPNFLAIWINSSFGKDQILRVQGGLAQQHFNVGEMKRVLVAKPPTDEQRAIVDRVDQLDQLLRTDKEHLAKLSLLKSGLMTDLLTGRVRVPSTLVLAAE